LAYENNNQRTLGQFKENSQDSWKYFYKKKLEISRYQKDGVLHLSSFPSKMDFLHGKIEFDSSNCKTYVYKLFALSLFNLFSSEKKNSIKTFFAILKKNYAGKFLIRKSRDFHKFQQFFFYFFFFNFGLSKFFTKRFRHIEFAFKFENFNPPQKNDNFPKQF